MSAIRNTLSFEHVVAGECRLRFLRQFAGQPVGLPLSVRQFSVVRHSCSHVAHFHSALYVDPFVTRVGPLSGSMYSSRSVFPRSPLASHHAWKLFVLLSGT